MTQYEFDNQKWYKGIQVHINLDNWTGYVAFVDFEKGNIGVSRTSNFYPFEIFKFHEVTVIGKIQPSALDLIAAEREKQISKGYTVEHDVKCYPYGGLIEIASNLVNFIPGHAVELCPSNWNIDYWLKLCNLDYKERVRISATWMARELERLLHLENKEQ